MTQRKITSRSIAANAITSDKIAVGAVTPPTPTAVSDQTNSSTGYFDVPAGTTAQRPASPNVGYIRYNTTLGFLEQYTADGWQGIAPPPLITSVSPTTYNGEQGTSFTINGSNFDTTATVKFITNQGAEFNAATVSRVNSAQLIATTPQDFTVAQEPLDVKVINGSGLAATIENVIDCGGVPTWNTASGSLGTAIEQASASFNVSAGDPDAGATVTYSLESGSLPSGLSLNSSTGAITGTTANLSSDTTYNFELGANDNAGNKTVRSFSIIVYSDLYDFASVELSEGVNVGRFGTDQSTWVSRVAQSWASNTSYFSVTNGIIYWTVPRTATYRILASGAGGASNSAGSQNPSKGAILRGNITLTRGTQLQILVGKRGDPVDSNGYFSHGAGGGGSFVAYADNTPLIVAGGGGGLFNATTLADQYFFGQTRPVPLTGFSSTPQSLTSGQGGYGWDAGGGGGFYGDGFLASGSTGTMITNNTGYSAPYGTQGRSFIRGSDRGIGGTNSSSTYGTDAEGGFGGGGGGHTGANAAGGGGGYTGGPGGYSGWGTTQGHGGGSFAHANMSSLGTSDAQYDGNGTYNGSAISNLGYNTANYSGYVIIERL